MDMNENFALLSVQRFRDKTDIGESPYRRNE
jgi:hypothetical protein